MTVVVICLLASFYGASILFQVKPMQKYLVKIDRWCMLPNYSFFAPNPLTDDFRLVYKVQGHDNEEWQEVDLYQDFRVLRIVWNPFKYYHKGMIDVCQFLIQEYQFLEASEKSKIKTSVNHLNVVLSIYRYLKAIGSDCQALKFAIIKSRGYKNSQLSDIIFNSEVQQV